MEFKEKKGVQRKRGFKKRGFSPKREFQNKGSSKKQKNKPPQKEG
ncbi:hypothetical protein HPHPA5_1559 [Helicobacter pylori Hp A-5]|nr:hypothetical protein HPHPA5_1559 [Helicobacter pylori Hp A-5]